MILIILFAILACVCWLLSFRQNSEDGHNDYIEDNNFFNN